MASPSGVSLQAFRQPSVYLVDCLKAPADVRPAVRPGPEVLSLKEPSVDLAAERSRAGIEVTPKDECEQSEMDFGNLQRTPDAIKLEPDQQPDCCDAGAENDCDCEIPKCEETKTEETDEVQWSNSMLVRQEDGGGSDGLIQDFKMSPKAALICNSEERREEDDVPTPEQHEAEDEEASEPEASPQTGEKRLLNALSGLSRQLTLFATDVNEQFTQLNSRLLSMEDRLAALESKNCAGETNSKKRRRVHNPKIAEAVRRLHNSETNCRRYEPEQGLTSPHNEAVTSYLLGAMSASPDLHDADNDDIVSACKTYYETVRRSFRYKQPDLAPQAEAVKSSAQSRSRRKRLLEVRQSVLDEEEGELWNSTTIDLMSDEEGGIVGGVSGWIVQPPSFRSQELTKLCATLQSRLEATPKYRAMHHRRL